MTPGQKATWPTARDLLMGEYVPSAAYQGDLMKEFEELTQSVGESVGTYAWNFKLMLKEISEEVRPSEYHQMIKFKKGLLDPFKLFIVIQDCVGLDELIERAKTLEAEVVMTSGKELSSGLTRGLVAHKPASKFMAEYHEQLGDKAKTFKDEASYWSKQ